MVHRGVMRRSRDAPRRHGRSARRLWPADRRERAHFEHRRGTSGAAGPLPRGAGAVRARVPKLRGAPRACPNSLHHGYYPSVRGAAGLGVHRDGAGSCSHPGGATFWHAVGAGQGMAPDGSPWQRRRHQAQRAPSVLRLRRGSGRRRQPTKTPSSRARGSWTDPSRGDVVASSPHRRCPRHHLGVRCAGSCLHQTTWFDGHRAALRAALRARCQTPFCGPRLRPYRPIRIHGAVGFRLRPYRPVRIRSAFGRIGCCLHAPAIRPHAFALARSDRKGRADADVDACGGPNRTGPRSVRSVRMRSTGTVPDIAPTLRLRLRGGPKHDHSEAAMLEDH